METPLPQQQLEGGTYEILRARLSKSGAELRARVTALNTERKQVFGAVDTRLIGTGRITTEHNCVPWDMVPLGQHFLFGFNVVLGLKTDVELSDVFGFYEYTEHDFRPQPLDLLRDARFEEEFRNLYRFYRQTQFTGFAVRGAHLFMVFRVGKSATDVKTFKWQIGTDDTLTYLDNRSEHEYTFPAQQEFTWKRATRDMQRGGRHPHISIEDRVFVETIGGDLTIKVEDNTETGQGILAEPVEQKDQTLDDAEIQYAVVGHLVLLKIRPYQEAAYRSFLYNGKTRSARRLDALADAVQLLPDAQGLIFPAGIALQSGDGKQFEGAPTDTVFERRVASPNGEDFLYVFYQRATGLYWLLSYNRIDQRVDAPIACHGFALFDNGELCFFRAEEEPRKHHAVQIWQTPYTAPNFELPVTRDSYLYKLGNKEVVRVLAEAQEVLNLTNREDSYAGLYLDLIRTTTTLLDTYHWLTEAAAQALAEPLREIRQTATAAVEEFDKVQRIRQSTAAETTRIIAKAADLSARLKRTTPDGTADYVQALADLRAVRGEVVALRELRYVDLPTVERTAADLEALTQLTATQTVEFLLRPDALAPYDQRVTAIANGVETVQKTVEADAREQEIGTVSTELELLIEVVGSLPIADPTQTTAIIERLSAIYARFNQIRAALKRRRTALAGTEAQAQFAAQLKLLEQSLVNYLDLSDTPAKCEEYQTRLLVQLEELEGRFPEFEGFLERIGEKREAILEAFESRKAALVAARNQRATALLQAAERLLAAVRSRVARLTTAAELNGYFAADVLVAKVRQTADDLLALGDPTKADDVQGRLKTLREEALRQLKDRTELYSDGGQTIRFGPHAFTVNQQPLELTTVLRDETLHYHLTGTNFFHRIADPAIEAARDLWDQPLVSENGAVYRAEFLAWHLLEAAAHPTPPDPERGTPAVLSLTDLAHLTAPELLTYVQAAMAPRYAEGYLKGVHDHDAALILEALVRLTRTADLLRYPADARAAAALWWQQFVAPNQRAAWETRLRGLGQLQKVFPGTDAAADLKTEIRSALDAFLHEHRLFDAFAVEEAADYLVTERTRHDAFIISAEAAELCRVFWQTVRERQAADLFDQSMADLAAQPAARFVLVEKVGAFLEQQPAAQPLRPWQNEAAVLLVTDSFDAARVVSTSTTVTLDGLQGTHARLQERRLVLDFPEFRHRLRNFTRVTVPRFEHFAALKKERLARTAEAMRLADFQPRVLTSFVRNRLLDQVYLPLIGANLAKQIGTAGTDKRTDRMGLLLLISPPGYGKTTLIEYVAARLGLVFVKVSGPALGHSVTSVDPAQAPNAGARDELRKLNLAFEMGDNVLIYLDDIQHCNPEFLQKFISLCDAQRRIEGVWEGQPRTYDFRGRKVAVVMAGNPYTESGDVFQLPDMLANRADIYNLGDIIGTSAEAFRLSYLENSLTANPILRRLATRSPADFYPILRLAEHGPGEPLDLEASHSPEEIQEYVAVLRHLLTLRDVVVQVNEAYIASAAQSADYRTEPPFRLQGSYRNMAKLAEKVQPLLNPAELQGLLADHYESEAQTLTTGAEANLLKLRELLGWLTEPQAARWEAIKATFRHNLRLSSGGQNAQVLEQLTQIAGGLEGIREALGAK
jgi:ATPase involved in DNA repair/AAA domain (dynein-related subfamily)